MSNHSPSKPPIDIGPAILSPLSISDAQTLGPAIARIEPWSRMGYADETLTNYLADTDANSGARKFGIWQGQDLTGCISVRDPWLIGPYLEMLALQPEWQGHGIGSAALNWFEQDATPDVRNLWVVSSTFNTRALAFYRRHGFEDVATLPSLVFDGFDEILLRKFPLAST